MYTNGDFTDPNINQNNNEDRVEHEKPVHNPIHHHKGGIYGRNEQDIYGSNIKLDKQVIDNGEHNVVYARDHDHHHAHDDHLHYPKVISGRGS